MAAPLLQAGACAGSHSLRENSAPSPASLSRSLTSVTYRSNGARHAVTRTHSTSVARSTPWSG